MKRLKRIPVLFFLLLVLPLRVQAETLLIPVGQIVGLQLQDNTITVAAFDDAADPRVRSCGLKVGDILLTVNGRPITTAEDVRSALACGGRAAVTVQRGTRRLELELEPEITAQGPHLGIYLRQGIAGVGTVTWYDPANRTFGALGHGVCSGGKLLEMTRGSIYPAGIETIVKGKSGQPGMIRGSTGSEAPCGELLRNTVQGVFGQADAGWTGQPIAAAEADALHTGPAQILSSVVSGSPAAYQVEILKLYPAQRTDGRNLLLKVTDPRLLEATGGIVQGMSGSPILQDGRLVGAVTHVLVNDPTLGYGIFIGNMLDAAA